MTHDGQADDDQVVAELVDDALWFLTMLEGATGAPCVTTGHGPRRRRGTSSPPRGRTSPARSPRQRAT